MKWLNRFEEMFIAIFLLISAVLVFLNVVLRSFGSGVSWSEELIRYMIIWTTFIGSSVCIREGSHISVDFILQMIKNRKITTIMMSFIYLIAILFSVLLTKYGFQFVQFSFNNNQMSPALNIPVYIVFLVLPLSGLLMLLRYIGKLKDLLRTRLNNM